MGRSGPGPDGLVVVDKPAGWTSHDVVARSRGILGTRKVGHSGTLDPDATGVLLLGVGRVTRLLRYLTALPKSYVGEIVLGTETDTLDAAGSVTATHDMADVTPAQVQAAASALTGDILQVPPMVSAVKVDGKRLHQLAREGKEVERPPRPVTVHRFTVEAVPGAAGVYRAEVDCSSGTYVRSLAADLGRALGGGAHLRALRRTAIGSFTLAEARPLEDPVVLPPAEALRDLPAATVGAEAATEIGFGRPLPPEALGLPPGPVPEGAGPWAVRSAAGELLAVYERRSADRLKPAVVLVPAAT